MQQTNDLVYICSSIFYNSCNMEYTTTDKRLNRIPVMMIQNKYICTYIYICIYWKCNQMNKTGDTYYLCSYYQIQYVSIWYYITYVYTKYKQFRIYSLVGPCYPHETRQNVTSQNFWDYIFLIYPTVVKKVTNL